MAKMLYKEGVDDGDIGRLAMHYIHDFYEDNQLDVWTLRHTAHSDSFGLLAVIPNTHWYSRILDMKDGEHDAELWMYGIPTNEQYVEMFEQELMLRNWAGATLSVSGKRCAAFPQRLSEDGMGAQTTDDYWVISE